MIDPKLNKEVPADANRPKNTGDTGSADAANLRRVSSQTSINDTVAANSNLSAGGQGVDTSGVSSGAGAGAGMTKPNATGSVMPSVVPGKRGTGTTALSSEGDASETLSPLTDSDRGYTDAEIEARAYHSWVERGQPHGSPEVDWEMAERDLREGRGRAAKA